MYYSMSAAALPWSCLLTVPGLSIVFVPQSLGWTRRGINRCWLKGQEHSERCRSSLCLSIRVPTQSIKQNGSLSTTVTLVRVAREYFTLVAVAQYRRAIRRPTLVPEVSFFSVRLICIMWKGDVSGNLKLLSSLHLFPLISATCAWIVLSTSVQFRAGPWGSRLARSPLSFCSCVLRACALYLPVTEPVISTWRFEHLGREQIMQRTIRQSQTYHF
jgi:hypothetical protein